MVGDFQEDMGDIRGVLGKHKELSTSIVWTPIPLLTWLLPCFGHIGIVTTTGVIRDFAGPYHVATDDMAFGSPTKYLPLSLNKVPGGASAWDHAIAQASEEYKKRNHNLLCDNCHDFVAMALNQMEYQNGGWNMLKLTALMFVAGRFLSVSAFLKTWLPTLCIIVCVTLFRTLVY